MISSGRHQQSYKACKMMNRIAQRYIHCYCSHQQDDWNQRLPAAVLACESSISNGIIVSPSEINPKGVPKTPEAS